MVPRLSTFGSRDLAGGEWARCPRALKLALGSLDDNGRRRRAPRKSRNGETRRPAARALLTARLVEGLENGAQNLTVLERPLHPAFARSGLRVELELQGEALGREQRAVALEGSLQGLAARAKA